MKIRANNFIDRTGMTFDWLTVLKFSGKNDRNQTMWTCVCRCGKKVKVRGVSLVSGLPRSCGCQRLESVRKIIQTHGESHNKTPEYNCWLLLRNRCKNPKCESYHRYGGRGIKVCRRWDSYQNFLKDMGRRPSDKHTIDRKNNDGDYKPSNCRWATRKQQANNRSKRRK